MSEEANKNFSGLLVECPDHKIGREDLVLRRGLSFEGPFAGRWESLNFESRTPLAGEDPRIAAPPYKYRILIRRSGVRLLLLSNHKDVAAHVIGLLQPMFRPRLRGVKIGVDHLVKRLDAETNHLRPELRTRARTRIRRCPARDLLLW